MRFENSMRYLLNGPRGNSNRQQFFGPKKGEMALFWVLPQRKALNICV